MAILNFDATKVEPDVGIDTVPVGWYNVVADESDLKPTRDGAGTYLQIRFNILDGQYRGRKLFTRLNIRNANAQAQEIALRQLSAIGHAVGVLHIQDSQQLHGLPLKVKVKIRKGDDNYDDQNEITVYKNINEPVETVGSAPAGVAPHQGFAQQPQQASQGFAPPTQFAQPPAQFPPAQVAPAQPWGQQSAPAVQPEQQFAAPAAAVQPWAQPQQPQQSAPAAAPAAQPWVPQQAAPAEVPSAAQPWNGGAAQPQAPAQQTAPQQPQVDPAQQAAIAAAQTAAPPWAQ